MTAFSRPTGRSRRCCPAAGGPPALRYPGLGRHRQADRRAHRHREVFPYTDSEELVRWQLEGTGFTLEDFDKSGFVAYTDKQILWDRKDGLKLKTPSKKFEFKSSLLENAGYPSFPPYEPVPQCQDNRFRLITGRHALHTHVSTQNNAYLNELMPENTLWINSRRAAALGIRDGGPVTITSKIGSGQLKAFVTDFIHPDSVFMLHGLTPGPARRAFL